MKLGWENKIIFHRIGWPENFGIFTTNDCPHHFNLNLKRQTGRTAIDIKLVCGNAFRLKKNLMTLFIRELDNFIFNRRTIARSNSFYLTRIHRRFM